MSIKYKVWNKLCVWGDNDGFPKKKIIISQFKNKGEESKISLGC